MNTSFGKILLFPNKYKYLGIVLVIIGIIASFIRFYLGIKPEFLNLTVFSFYSSYLEPKYMLFTTNNFFEEICGLSILVGLILLAFSKEKVETKNIMEIRLGSIFNAVFFNAVILLVAQLFFFGLGFVYIMILNLFSTLIIYLFIFYYRLYSIKK